MPNIYNSLVVKGRDTAGQQINGIKWYSSFVGSLEDYNHAYCFPIGCFALIVTSSILLISVPVVFASSNGRSSNKNIVFFGTSLWIELVFLVAILNSLIF
ncbi:hypothetical protein AMTRI_Chr05g70130 [Amborella trichopoda]